MKYKFSNLTGRLSAPSPLDTPSKFGNFTEEPKIQYQFGTTFPKEVSATRPRGGYGYVPGALQKKMALFQFPNSMPVHLKGGPVDRFLMIATGAVCLIGFVECLRVYYVLSFPQRKE